MDKRKKLVKLFYEIKTFVGQKALNSDPYAFLLNKFALTLQNKRPAANTLSGISKADFSLINNEFSDRLGRDFILSLSLTQILSLPSERVIEVSNIKVLPKQSLLVLTDTVVLPYEIEKKIQLFIGYCSERTPLSPFQNVEYYPIARDAALSISIQSTLFDLISNDNTQLKPVNFDVIIDDSVSYLFPSENLLNTLSVLLRPNGVFFLMVKKTFLSTPLTKKEKKSLYSLFEPKEIDRFPEFLLLRLEKRIEEAIVVSKNIMIKDQTNNKTLELEKSSLDFNHLFTFNDNVSAEQLDLIAKIEEKAGYTCGDYFRFFLGMFRNGPVDSLLESLRKSAEYQPLITSKELLPFCTPKIKRYIYPDEKSFFQIPPHDNFVQKKLLMKYLSVKPVFVYDQASLYFMNDIAAVIPRTPDVDFFFAEGYLNSKLVEFFYKVKFPHHNKFLKKNFCKIPFFKCPSAVQNVISALVKKMHTLYEKQSVSSSKDPALEKEISASHKRLDSFIYQLFKLDQDEVDIIERFVEADHGAQEAADEE